ncbi:hypothetical protein KCP69_25755 [Salmonella enterica subsp. enterica]|nr:hypothetical protein KCP69_25755 [Salmonella enterica subsp. enterica]
MRTWRKQHGGRCLSRLLRGFTALLAARLERVFRRRRCFHRSGSGFSTPLGVALAAEGFAGDRLGELLTRVGALTCFRWCRPGAKKVVQRRTICCSSNGGTLMGYLLVKARCRCLVVL